MIDEIDLLQRYRSNVPDPSPEAWERAWLSMSGVAPGKGISRHARGAWRRQRWMRVLLPVVASAAAVLVVVTLPAVHLPVHHARKASTAWQPTRPLPVISVGGQHGAGWHLSGYLVSRIAPVDGSLACPSADVCYEEGSNRAAGDVLFVTSDAAASWGMISMPAGMRFTTALSCWSVTSCAAGVTHGGEPATAFTADGGHTWTFDRLPGKIGKLFTLDCPRAGTCYGLASTSPANGFAAPANATFVTIAGGRITDGTFPSGQMESLSCATAENCVALGLRGTPPASGAPVPGEVEITSDGGTTWSAGRLPGDYENTGTDALDCADSMDCWATGMYAMDGSAILSSTDGGRTWHYRYQVTANSHQPVGSVLACPSAGVCQLAGGWPDWGVKIGDTTYNYLAMFTTRNAGARWHITTLGIPAHLPPGGDPGNYGYIPSLQCPTVTFCVGLGSLTQGSTADPVYTFGQPPAPSTASGSPSPSTSPSASATP